MKKTKKIAAITFIMMFVLAMPVNAGGAPAAHGVSGSEFGPIVSATAQIAPGALADHTSGKAQGNAAAHGVSGRQFGQAVSYLADMYPGAVADHVK